LLKQYEKIGQRTFDLIELKRILSLKPNSSNLKNLDLKSKISKVSPEYVAGIPVFLIRGISFSALQKHQQIHIGISLLQFLWHKTEI